MADTRSETDAKTLPEPSAAPKQPQQAQGPDTSVLPAGLVDLPHFKIMAKQALRTLPRQVPIEGLTDEEAHHMSAKSLEALQPMVDIVQAVADNPKLEEAGFAFYRKCASDDKLNLLSTLRASCLSHMRALENKLNKKSEVDRLVETLNSANPAIVDLANALD